MTYNFLKRAGRGRAAGAAKHLEFSAGGDQRKMVTRVGTIKAQHLNTTIYRTITIRMIIEVLGGSVGGLYKRACPVDRMPLSLPALCRIFTSP